MIGDIIKVKQVYDRRLRNIGILIEESPYDYYRIRTSGKFHKTFSYNKWDVVRKL